MNTQANDAVQAQIDDLAASGQEVGLQVAAYHNGKLIVDAWAGVADEASGQYLVYSPAGAQIEWRGAVAALAARSATWFDPQTGALQAAAVAPGSTLAKPTPGAWLLWVR